MNSSIQPERVDSGSSVQVSGAICFAQEGGIYSILSRFKHSSTDRDVIPSHGLSWFKCREELPGLVSYEDNDKLTT